MSKVRAPPRDISFSLRGQRSTAFVASENDRNASKDDLYTLIQFFPDATVRRADTSQRRRADSSPVGISRIIELIRRATVRFLHPALFIGNRKCKFFSGPAMCPVTPGRCPLTLSQLPVAPSLPITRFFLSCFSTVASTVFFLEFSDSSP